MNSLRSSRLNLSRKNTGISTIKMSKRHNKTMKNSSSMMNGRVEEKNKKMLKKFLDNIFSIDEELLYKINFIGFKNEVALHLVSGKNINDILKKYGITINIKLEDKTNEEIINLIFVYVSALIYINLETNDKMNGGAGDDDDDDDDVHDDDEMRSFISQRKLYYGVRSSRLIAWLLFICLLDAAVCVIGCQQISASPLFKTIAARASDYTLGWLIGNTYSMAQIELIILIIQTFGNTIFSKMSAIFAIYNNIGIDLAGMTNEERSKAMLIMDKNVLNVFDEAKNITTLNLVGILTQASSLHMSTRIINGQIIIALAGVAVGGITWYVSGPIAAAAVLKTGSKAAKFIEKSTDGKSKPSEILGSLSKNIKDEDKDEELY